MRSEAPSLYIDKREMDAMTDHLLLPEREELDKLLWYEAVNYRQLNHASLRGYRRAGRENGLRFRAILRNKAKNSFDFNRIVYSSISNEAKIEAAFKRERDQGGDRLPATKSKGLILHQKGLPGHEVAGREPNADAL